jgi:hypothetical protein
VRRLFLASGFLLLTLSQSLGIPSALAQEVAYDVNPREGTDETLFQVRALETLCQGRPGASAGEAALRNWVALVRPHLARFQEQARVGKLDPELLGLLDDLGKGLNDHETYFSNLARIRSDFWSRERNDGEAARRTAEQLSDHVMKQSEADGDSFGKQLGKGLGSRIGSEVGFNLVRGGMRERDKQGALNSEADRIESLWSDVLGRAAGRTLHLTQNLGWRRGEAGFDRFTSDTMGELIERRPRDPFLRVWNAQIRVNGEGPAEVLNDARTCVDAARMVPAGRPYELFRRDFVRAAADLALLAAGMEINYSYSAAPAKGGREAVRFCRTYLSLDPEDAYGVGNMMLARALAMCGRFDDAVTAANKADANPEFHNDPYFAYRYAKLMTLTGNVPLALDWLRWSISKGFDDVAAARTDPDLKRLREEKSDEFARLTRIAWAWDIGWGYQVASDTVTLTNNSRFSLHDVELTPTVHSDGYADWQTTLRCDRIGPGEPHTWTLGVSAITSRGWDAKGRATLSCRENR